MFLSLGNYLFTDLKIIMRNRIPFGYISFGGSVLVKLNVKLSGDQCKQLMNKYPNVLCFDIGKFGKAIEGTLKYSEHETFIRDLNIMKMDAKIERLIEAKTKILDSFITPNFDTL